MSHYSRFNGLKRIVFVIQGFYEPLDFLVPLTYMYLYKYGLKSTYSSGGTWKMRTK